MAVKIMLPLIAEAIKLGVGNSKSLYNLLEGNEAYAKKFSRGLEQSYGVKTFAEIDEIASYYEAVINESGDRSPNEIADIAHKRYELNSLDVYVICPLDTKVAFSNRGISRQIQLLEGKLFPVQRSYETLVRTLKRMIPGFVCPRDFANHFNEKSYNALFTRQLLVFHFKGTYEKVKVEARNKLMLLRRLAELVLCEPNDVGFGNNTGGSLALEFRPNHVKSGAGAAFHYNWTNELSNIGFELSKSSVPKLRAKNSREVYRVLLEGGKNDLRQRIFRSLHLYSRGYNQANDLDSFIFFIISLESLFSRDKNNPIRVTLADYVALMHPAPSERILLHTQVKKLYDLRSKIFHTGEGYVSRQDIQVLRAIVSNAIQAVILLASKHPSLDEKGLFDYLLKQKLHV